MSPHTRYEIDVARAGYTARVSVLRDRVWGSSTGVLIGEFADHIAEIHARSDSALESITTWENNVAREYAEAIEQAVRETTKRLERNRTQL